MTQIVEHNDVDISQLFNWGRVFILEDSEGKELAMVYMKLLGDADSNRARVYALRKSGELRKALHDETSGERLALIHPIEELENEHLINYAITFSLREIQNRAIKEVTIPKPKQPKSNASLSKLEKYQKELDEWPERLNKELNAFIKKEVDKLRKELSTLSREQLYKRYVQSLIDEFCEQEAVRAHRDMQVYLGCFKDDEYKERFFSSFEEFDNLDTKYKEDFRAAFDKIEVSPHDLKKLREATL